MDNQHKKITGYRDLSQEEINLMNEIKATGETVAAMCLKVRAQRDPINNYPTTDMRWLSIAETHLQQGIMALVRAVAQPTTF